MTLKSISATFSERNEKPWGPVARLLLKGTHRELTGPTHLGTESLVESDRNDARSKGIGVDVYRRGQSGRSQDL